MTKWIPVDKAVVDLLKEYGLTIDDIVEALELEGIDVYSELIKRIHDCTKDVVEYIYTLPRRTAALLLFTIQSLYIVNASGLYKGYRINPPRETVVVSNKVCFNGLLQILIYLRNIT